MPTSILAMDNSLAFVSQLGSDSFDSNSLLELHTAWMDNEELNQLPLYMDVETDDSIPGAQYLSINSPKAVQTAADQSALLQSGLNIDLDDHDAQLLDAALEPPFGTELSPILEPFADTPAAASPLKIPCRRCKNNATEHKVIDSSLKRTAQVSVLGKSKTGDETALAAVTTPRPRTRSSSWQQQEQNAFFTLFKVKWPLTPKSEPQPTFSSLLLQRFDAISTKIRTKSVMEVRHFYTTVMQNVGTVLQVVDNDVDLTNPDQVRIALWCWSKLMAETKYRDEFLGFDAAPVKVKASLATVLLQSIIRSRRQMLKAKSEKLALTSDASTPSRPSISAWVSRSHLSSFFAGAEDTVSKPSTVQIHYPMVRKKQSALQRQTASLLCASSTLISKNGRGVRSLPATQQAVTRSANESSLKRKRNISTNYSPATAKRQYEYMAATFTSKSPTNVRSKSHTQRGVAFHTPGQLLRRKTYMKMRMVPQDKQTKANVVRGGYKPKVELKLSSTKKISEIVAYMSKKWAKVRRSLPKEAVLCFFEKKDKGGWSKEDSDVTCLDIWKRSGKRTNDENVVDVSYVWMVPETDVGEDGDAPVQDLVFLAAPPKLVEPAACAASNQELSSSDEIDTGHFCSTWALPEFGDEVPRMAAEGGDKAFNLKSLASDSCDDDGSEKFNRTTGRRRRRIKPVLVSKEEFNI